MPQACTIKHVEGSAAQRICPTHGVNVRRSAPRTPVVSPEMIPRPLRAAPGDSADQHKAMLRSNGPINRDAAQAGLLPLCDRAVTLSQRIDGLWVISLSDVADERNVHERGEGGTPAEAFYRALAQANGLDPDEDVPLVLLRADEWADATQDSAGEIRHFPMPDSGDLPTALGADYVPMFEDEAGAHLREFRAWVCTRGSIREI